MIADWRTYSVEDFIPFTADVYFRLIERTNEAAWPLHVLTLIGGLAAAMLLVRGGGRTAGALLALAWLWPGGVFLLQRYSELNWAGDYFGWAFLGQAVVVFCCALVGRFKWEGFRRFGLAEWAGFALFVYGLAAYLFWAPVAGGGWAEAEVFGVHPDPTAVATIGFVLVAAGRWSGWICWVIPALWCLVSALTLRELDVVWAPGLTFAAAVGLAGLIWKSFRRRPRSGESAENPTSPEE